jgi:hypothetical protein
MHFVISGTGSSVFRSKPCTPGFGLKDLADAGMRLRRKRSGEDSPMNAEGSDSEFVIPQHVLARLIHDELLEGKFRPKNHQRLTQETLLWAENKISSTTHAADAFVSFKNK